MTSPETLRIAYADPPYIGQARKHYSHDPQCAEVDHRALLVQLRDGFPDGWALSASAPSLEEILGLCRDVLGPNVVRVSPWVKPFASYKPGVNPAFCWEPVIWCGGRSAAARGGKTAATVRDYLSANITMQRGLSGVKPDAFSFWLFELLGLRAGDLLCDLFPGSGAVTRAWQTWCWHNSGDSGEAVS